MHLCKLVATWRAAFRSGAVMGFLLASTGLLVLWLTIHAFWLVRLAGFSLFELGEQGSLSLQAVKSSAPAEWGLSACRLHAGCMQKIAAQKLFSLKI